MLKSENIFLVAIGVPFSEILGGFFGASLVIITDEFVADVVARAPHIGVLVQ